MVHSVDDFWHRKYAEDEDGRLAPVVAGGANGARRTTEHEEPGTGHDGHDAEGGGHGHGIHMPSPSYFPLVAALGHPAHRLRPPVPTFLAIDGGADHCWSASTGGAPSPRRPSRPEPGE